ncbi:MAG: histidine phosphatase family protein [Lentisphaeria bacterium]|nr:histidine phosphatase family protein [Lentisphaeria bacterium]
MKKMLFVLSLLGTILLSAQDQPLIVRLVRHGQPGVKGTDFTPADKKNWIVLGLTPLGRKQAETTGRFLKKEGIQWSRIIASPQERASETADIICGILGKTFALDSRLREVGNPIRETLPGLRSRFKQIAPEEKMELTSAQRRGFKEKDQASGQRGRQMLMKLIQEKIEGPVLLVTHGHFMYTTILEMTGKSVRPWNCGMAELKVWPDGRAELVKGTYPEVLEKSLITDNAKYFDQNPWFPKFLPHPGPRPDAVSLLNEEFRKFIGGRRSSWDRKRGIPVNSVETGKGKLILTGGKKHSTVVSPRFPLKAGVKYRLRITASGNGSGMIKLARSQWQKKMELSPETGEYELQFSPAGKISPWYEIHLEAAPESQIIMTNLSFRMVQ